MHYLINSKSIIYRYVWVNKVWSESVLFSIQSKFYRHHQLDKMSCLNFMTNMVRNYGIQILYLSKVFWQWNFLSHLLQNLNRLDLLPNIVFNNCWLRGKQCRPWSDASVCSVSSGSSVCSGLSVQIHVHRVAMVQLGWNRLAFEQVISRESESHTMW